MLEKSSRIALATSRAPCEWSSRATPAGRLASGETVMRAEKSIRSTSRASTDNGTNKAAKARWNLVGFRKARLLRRARR